MSLLKCSLPSFPACLVFVLGTVIKTLSVYHIHCKKSAQKPKRARSPEGVSRNGWSSAKHTKKKALPNFFNYMDLEHTPINIPDSNHSFLCPDDATVIPTSPESVPNSGASSSSKQEAASRVPSLFGPSSLWKQGACHVSPGNWSRVDRESVATTLFSSQSKRKRDRDTHVVHSLKDSEKSPKNPWTESRLGRPRREKLSKIVSSWGWGGGEKLGKEKFWNCFSRGSIRNLNLSDFSYIKQVDGQIRLKETKLACMDKWIWEIGSSKKIMQEIDQKLKNWEQLVAKKQIKQDNQELKNCNCNNRGILQLWVNYCLKFWIFRNKVNSLLDARAFYDLEPGSSSGATHVPDQTSTVLCSRTLPHCDSGLPRNTQNCMGIMGNILGRPPAQEGRPSTFFNKSKNLAELRKGHLRYCCTQDWMKNGGRIPWSTTAICETSKTSWEMRNTIRKTIWRTIQRANNSFWSNGWVLPVSANLARKYYQESFWAMC